MRRAVAAALALFFCTLAGATRAADPFEIDTISSLTGPSTFVGQGTRQGLSAVEEIVNEAGGIRGRPIKFVIHDDQSNPQLSVQIANQIMARHPAVILGGTFGASCRAMFPLSKSGPVMYCMTPAVVPVVGSYDFSAGVANQDLTRAAIRYFRRRGWTRIATITATDATGQDNDQAIDEILALPENKGVTLVGREHFAVGDLSVNAQLVRIKASPAQVLIIGTAGTPTGTIMRGITEVGLTIPVGINYGNATHAQMTQLAKYLPKELYFFGTPFLSPNEVTDRATKRAVDRYYATLTGLGYRADASQVAGYDTASLAAYVFQKLGTDVTAEQFRSYLANLRGWVGVNGPYDFKTFPQRGLGPTTAVISRWDAEKDAWIGVSKPGGDPLAHS